jgi:hypothetical protein
MQLALTRLAPTGALSLTYANVSREPATADRTRALLLHNVRDDRRRTTPKLGGSFSTSRGGSLFASAAGSHVRAPSINFITAVWIRSSAVSVLLRVV